MPAHPEAEELEPYALSRCKRCGRILPAADLKHGQCLPGLDCYAHEMIRRAAEDGHAESWEFVRNVERGLCETRSSE